DYYCSSYAGSNLF
nr:immunoglobulin light chain junction region [Macaca mulatta]MOW27718.1 immunoglobulin light chain junction region [Macaca mulatta]MOW29319.1 immunoglobulin light chain junction region [Macaca mulatta]MOW30779.1 immunoglobulin light chain junction region [Macaca mulatta]